MKNIKYFIGLDISADDFSASCITNPDNLVFPIKKFSNNTDGFNEFLALLSENNITQSNAIICMEATGVYCDEISYFLASQGFNISIEAPHKIKNKTKDSPRKNDFIDALAIAEYAYRYLDKLPFWKPKNAILDELQTLLSAREQLVVEKTATKNALNTLKRKHHQVEKVKEIYEKNIKELEKQIKEIDREIKTLINKDDTFKQKVSLAMSVPGVKLLLAANLLVITNGFTEHLNYRQIASYIGICPYEQISGTSLRKPPKSRRCGPYRLRKLIYLAALSVATYNPKFIAYFESKVSQGKNKRLVINNIKNKLLRITLAVVKSGVPYDPNFISIKPVLV